MDDNDLLEFIDDEPATPGAPGHAATPAVVAAPATPWHVLVVDDDPDVHEATRFALRSVEVQGRPLHLLHAHSAAQGLQALRDDPEVAVVLLDVVMETDDAGLRLVDQIRNDLQRHTVRIILRTGQPGQVPELATIQRYDINDYRTKSELTRTRLVVSLMAALRAWDQLQRLESSRLGLEKVIAASQSFIAESGMAAFAEGIILQLAGLMGVAAQGLVCVRADAAAPATEQAAPGFVVIAAAGPYRHLIHRQVDEIDSQHVVNSLRHCLATQHNVLNPHDMVLYFPSPHGQDSAAYVALPGPISDTHRHLLDLFCSNISLWAANVGLVERLRQSAYMDRQLGVANRNALLDHLDQLRGQAEGTQLALLDIDHFAELNDLLGYRVGDALLQALVRRLAEAVGPHGLVARVGSNAFALCARAGQFSEPDLRALLARPFSSEGIDYPLSACIGWLDGHQAGGERTDSGEWLKKAAIALKQAKRRGPGQTETFLPALNDASQQRALLLHDLRRAADRDRLTLFYQPKLHLGSGRVVGLEALMRWPADDGRMVPPDRFIPLAEQSGLILPLGAWALRTALAALRQLHQAGHSQLHMAVNVTASQFAQPGFVDQVMQALAQAGVAPAHLELEITESVAISGLEVVGPVLHALRAQGISLAIDDFGTGYSSLSYLDQLPAQRLKIDRAFVQQLDSPGARIAGLIVPLGHQLGMTVLAEGVETEAQAQALRELGCDEAQGYLYARPLALADLLPWLNTRRASAPLGTPCA